MTNIYIKHHIRPIYFKAQGIACSLFCLNVLSVTKKPKAMKTKTQYTKNEIKYCPLHDFDYTSKIINQHFFLHFFSVLHGTTFLPISNQGAQQG